MQISKNLALISNNQTLLNNKKLKYNSMRNYWAGNYLIAYFNDTSLSSICFTFPIGKYTKQGFFK